METRFSDRTLPLTDIFLQSHTSCTFRITAICECLRDFARFSFISIGMTIHIPRTTSKPSRIGSERNFHQRSHLGVISWSRLLNSSHTTLFSSNSPLRSLPGICSIHGVLEGHKSEALLMARRTRNWRCVSGRIAGRIFTQSSVNAIQKPYVDSLSRMNALKFNRPNPYLTSKFLFSCSMIAATFFALALFSSK